MRNTLGSSTRFFIYCKKTSGYDLSDFYVPAGELQPRVTSARRATIRRPGHVRYSDDKFCERSLLMMKIEGVLTFFRIQESPQKTTIGFQPPQ